jgi:uncharacterized repeat protein (TIGR02543 family)
MVKGGLPTYDLAAPVEGKYALAVAANKVKPVASYVDDSVLVTFRFEGISHPDAVQKIRKGTEADLSQVEEIVAEQGMAVKDISPALGRLFANTTYTVTCGELSGPKVTISFEENGGSEIADITKVTGSLIGSLPTPVKSGYTFDGWYTGENLSTVFAANKMPSENITLYAKWVANSFTATLHANGGTFGGDISTLDLTVTYGNPYGNLPAPVRSSKSFAGWFTEPQGGTEVKDDTVVETAVNHTLYAHWEDLKSIDNSAFTFKTVTATYQKGVGVPAEFEKSEAYANLEGFTFEYRKQSDPNAVINTPVDAGIYDIVVKRAQDNTYAQFEYRYQGVVVINKAVRNLDTVALAVNRAGYTYLDLKPAEGAIDDLSPKAKFTYNAVRTDGKLLFPNDSGSSNPGSGYIGGLLPATDYYVTITVTDDPNYEDAAFANGYTVRTLEAPADSWFDYTETLDISSQVVYISTPGQLAMLSKLVREGSFITRDYTFVLTNDIDLTGHIWEPVYSKDKDDGDDTQFQGTFDGNSFTIRGLFAKKEGASEFCGLFGITCDNAIIKNLIIEESYIEGNGYSGFAGGIVGKMIDGSRVENCISNVTIKGLSAESGGIAGQLNGWAVVSNCVNYGNVTSNGYTGGIVGNIWRNTNSVSIINCVNYGKISGEISVGGIAGRQITGIIVNSANFGRITGTSRNIGSIVGENDGKNSRVYNCYSDGTVIGSGKYVGAVVGRNNNDNGVVKYCYYLAGSATCDGNNRSGLGTETGSVEDGKKGYDVASFTSPTSTLSRDAGYGKDNLISALNEFVKYADNYRGEDLHSDIAVWDESEGGYPVPNGLPVYTKK